MLHRSFTLKSRMKQVTDRRYQDSSSVDRVVIPRKEISQQKIYGIIGYMEILKSQYYNCHSEMEVFDLMNMLIGLHFRCFVLFFLSSKNHESIC